MGKRCNTPLVSVIVPVYNTESYLHQCLESIVTQTLDSLEIIIVNDGSTDSSMDIIQQFASKDKRITVLDQENQGRGRARNNALLHATGEYVSFIDSDDFIEKHFFEKLLTVTTNLKHDIILGKIINVDYTGKPLKYQEESIQQSKKDIFKAALNISFPTGACDKIYKLNLLQSNNITFDTDIEFGEDLIFYLKVIYYASTLVTVNDAIYFYRNLGISAMGPFDLQLKYKQGFISSTKKFLQENDLYEEYEKDFAVFYFRNVVMSSIWQIETLIKSNISTNYSLLDNFVDKELLQKHDVYLKSSSFHIPYINYMNRFKSNSFFSKLINKVNIKISTQLRKYQK